MTKVLCLALALLGVSACSLIVDTQARCASDADCLPEDRCDRERCTPRDGAGGGGGTGGGGGATGGGGGATGGGGGATGGGGGATGG
ncbi:MAG: hypothetical protein AB1938_14800, partial [Myxococcota bacterium]